MIDTAAILDRVSLRDLVARDTEVAKDRAWCPFCQPGGRAQNNSPAMSLKGGKLFRCFGCGESGDAISYIMRRDGLDFREACLTLGWDGREPDRNELARLQAEHQAAAAMQAAQRQAELDALLAEYSTTEIWLAYTRRMQADNRAWWRGRGVPDEWQAYLRLGFTPEKIYLGKSGELLRSPAYVIPYFQASEFKTIQYRLSNPDRPNDRYRFEKDLPATWYQVVQGPVAEYAVIAEGAIKAMVAHIYGSLPETVSVLAIPARNSFSSIAASVAHCSRVWVVLDPDCWTKPANASAGWEPDPVKLARLIGKQARIVRLPAKVDDAMLEGALSAEGWRAALKGGFSV